MLGVRDANPVEVVPPQDGVPQERPRGGARLGATFRKRRHATVVVSLIATLAAATIVFHARRTRSAELGRRSDSATVERFAENFDAVHFQRGNIHAHSRLSDGDSKPEAVITWYRKHGYQFAALTDHNVFFDPHHYAAMTGPGFTLISGEEITMTGRGRQVHVNALCTRSKISGGRFETATEALAIAIGEVRAQDGVALVNHPNFDWALSAADVAGARRAQLLEVASGHPYVHAAGDATHPSAESLWDLALSTGDEFMAVAVDDTHHLQHGKPAAYPGKGWVEVFAEHADPVEICSALAQGRLYASTGVDLERISVEGNEYSVVPATSGVHVSFIGAAGRLLWRSSGNAHQPVRYALHGGEVYVRARIEDKEGHEAWTPAIRVVQSG